MDANIKTKYFFQLQVFRSNKHKFHITFHNNLEKEALDQNEGYGFQGGSRKRFLYLGEPSI
jgi:hypothetical protein